MKRLAWSLAALCVVFSVVDTIITALAYPLFSEEAMARHGWPFGDIATIGSAALGALIISRYPRHRIGWLLVVAGFSASLSIVTEAYASWVLTADGPGGAEIGHVSSWLASLFGAPLAFAMLTLIFLTAPDGNLQSRGWRWAAGSTIGGISIYTVAVLTSSPTESVPGGGDQKYSLATQVLFVVGFLSLAAGMTASAVGLIMRLRRSSGVRRQQLRWIAVSAAALAFGVIWLLAVSSVISDSQQTWLTAMPLFIAYVLLPMCVGVAVLRYRLYDLDLIINRAIVLAVGTAFAAAGYIGLVVGVGAAVGTWAQGFRPSLVATVVVAVAFQPVRARVVQLADRLAYGKKAIPYEALSDLSQRIGESPEPQHLLPTVAQAAGAAVVASAVTVRLTLASNAERSASWPLTGAQTSGRTSTTVFAVIHDGERLGSIDVRMPAGRSLRPRDHVLLGALAEQVALAFRQARLARQLAERVELLDRRAAELAESRERIIAARDAEQSRLESTIRRDVIVHVQDLPQRLDELSRTPATRHELAAPVLSELVDRAVAALEALREITRGIFPTQLTRAGLPAAIATQLGATATAGVLTVSERFGKRRCAPAVEAAIYFCYLETIGTFTSLTQVELDVECDVVTLRLTGLGAADPDVAPLQDRLDPWGGRAWGICEGERVIVTVSVPDRDSVGVPDDGEGGGEATVLSAGRDRAPSIPR